MPREIEYDRRAGQYRGLDGRFIGRSRIESLVLQELGATELRMRELTTNLIDGSLLLEDWQTSIASKLKDSHIRLGLLASGGVNATGQKEFLSINTEIKKQFDYFNSFSESIGKGDLSVEQILARINQYAKSGRSTFYKLELETRRSDGFKRGRRLLDPQSNHCAACLNHQRIDWVDLSDLIAPGTDCQCRVNCRCRLLYSRF